MEIGRLGLPVLAPVAALAQRHEVPLAVPAPGGDVSSRSGRASLRAVSRSAILSARRRRSTLAVRGRRSREPNPRPRPIGARRVLCRPPEVSPALMPRCQRGRQQTRQDEGEQGETVSGVYVAHHASHVAITSPLSAPFSRSATTSGRTSSMTILVSKWTKSGHTPDLVSSPENEKPRYAGLSCVGGTGLEPVTPSLSSWCSPN
jgi:hypothetical protein